MNLAFVALKAFPQWNRRIITERDIQRVCKKKCVHIVEGKVGVPGLYIPYAGFAFIVIDPDLPPAMRLWVLLHELAHHLLHVPGLQLFDKRYKTKADFEANFIAAIGAITLEMVMTKLPGEIQEEYGYPKELTDLRKWIYDNYRI